MPLSSDLRSDYPLNLTLFERPYDRALKQSYRAGLASARRIPVPLTSSKRWFLARLLVDRAVDAQYYSGTNGGHCHSVEPRVYTGSCTNFCSSACAPSASVSTYGLTYVRALVRAFRHNIDDQLAHLVEHWRAGPRGNSGPHSYALTSSLLSPNSALYAVVAELDARSALRVCHFLVCLFVDSGAGQINSSQINVGGAHDVSKQRSSKF
jgi:hypothetical protein